MRLLPDVKYTFSAYENNGTFIKEKEVELEQDSMVIDFGFYDEKVSIDPNPFFLDFANISIWNRKLDKKKNRINFSMVSSSNNRAIMPKVTSSFGFYQIKEKDGEIFNKYVIPSVISPREICANYIISSFLQKDFSKKDVFDHKFHIKTKNEFKDNEDIVIYGSIEAKNNKDGILYNFEYYLFCDGLKDLKCFIINKCNEKELFKQKTIKKKQEYLKKLSKGKFYSLSDLKVDNSDELIANMAKTICCIKKVIDSSINSYTIEGDNVVCSGSGENEISC